VANSFHGLRVTAFLALAAVGCGGRFEGGGELRARRVVLQREVDGMREVVARLERREPMLPEHDIAVAIEDDLVRDLISAELPFDADVDRYHLSLRKAEVAFRGNPMVRLHGVLHLRDKPGYEATVSAIGALEGIVVDDASSTLEAKIALDHIGIEQAAGLEQWLSGAALDEVARMVRLEVAGKLPPIRIPVRVQPRIELPAVTDGPVRIEGASVPLDIAVSRVVAGQGTLWVALRVRPGELVKAGAGASVSRPVAQSDAPGTGGRGPAPPVARRPR
jgi:hypothetical protein